MRLRLIFRLLILLPLLLLLAGPGLLPAQGPPADLSNAWLLQQGPTRRSQINFMNAAIDHQFLVYSRGTREIELVYIRDSFAAPDDWQAFSCPGFTLSVSRRPERLVAVYTHDNNRHFVFAFSALEQGRREAVEEPDCTFVSELLSEFRFFGGLTARESLPAPFPAAF